MEREVIDLKENKEGFGLEGWKWKGNVVIFSIIFKIEEIELFIFRKEVLEYGFFG